MFRYIICLLIIFLLPKELFAQNKQKEINTLEKLFSNFSEGASTYKLSYMENKKTFVLKVSTNEGASKIFKFLEEDIHPEGVFFDELKRSYTLKILSIDNGHRFIFTKLRNKTKLSNTTNIIEIDNINPEKKEILKKFIIKLRDYRKSLIEKKTEELQIISNGSN